MILIYIRMGPIELYRNLWRTLVYIRIGPIELYGNLRRVLILIKITTKDPNKCTVRLYNRL